MYQKILVPLDGSGLAECTLSHVKSLAKGGFAGEVTILNIVEIDIPWGNVETGKGFDLNALREAAFKSAGKYISELGSRLTSEGIKVKTDIIEANRPAETITDYAREKKMDLIVMATHGNSGFKKLLLGSVSSGVLNQSSVPVLLIRPEACRIS
ncbi:MAG: universal stress protein [Deltaproteobacteria bacterium]|nr:universal stress protein [Deltaproteobacteria bacterium]